MKQLTVAELVGELLANLENDIASPQRATDLDDEIFGAGPLWLLNRT